MGTINITTMWQILLYTSFKKSYYIRHWHYADNISCFLLHSYVLPLPPVTLQSASHSLTPQQAFTSQHTISSSICKFIYRLPQQIPKLLPLGLAARTEYPTHLLPRKSFSWHHYCNTLVVSLQWYGQTIFKGKDKMIKAIHLHAYNIM
jgi:hypothetical protein